MITRETVSEKLIAYLDDRLSLNQVIAWAERAQAEGICAPDSNIDLLAGIVLSLAGADRPHLPDAVIRVTASAMPADAA